MSVILWKTDREAVLLIISFCAFSWIQLSFISTNPKHLPAAMISDLAGVLTKCAYFLRPTVSCREYAAISVWLFASQVAASAAHTMPSPSASRGASGVQP